MQIPELKWGQRDHGETWECKDKRVSSQPHVAE